MIVDIISKLDDSTKTPAYADDVTAAGKIIQLKNWWKTVYMVGPKLGYYSAASKSWLIVKEKAKQRAFTVFKDTAIKILTEGQRHLGAVIDSTKYKREYVQNKINELINEIKIFVDDSKNGTSSSILLLHNSIQTQIIIHHEDHT